MANYTATYEPQTVHGEPGYWYECFANGRLIFSGWSRGKKQHAEAEVREGVSARESLRACTELA